MTSAAAKLQSSDSISRAAQAMYLIDQDGYICPRTNPGIRVGRVDPIPGQLDYSVSERLKDGTYRPLVSADDKEEALAVLYRRKGWTGETTAICLKEADLLDVIFRLIDARNCLRCDAAEWPHLLRSLKHIAWLGYEVSDTRVEALLLSCLVELQLEELLP